MSGLEAVLVLLAGMAAGTVNAIVGSGTLITFPVLLAVGYSPVVANVSNTVGLAPGSISAALGYRAELAGQGQRLKVLGLASLTGGVTGGVLLLTLPEDAFQAIVPVLIALSCVLVVLQPWLTRAWPWPSDAASTGESRCSSASSSPASTAATSAPRRASC